MRSDATSGPDLDDLELIERWKGGDELAASRLVGRYAESLARYVGSFAGGAVAVDVQEVVQDTFVRAFGAIDTFRGDSSLGTWLFSIARRLVLDARRSANRHRDLDEVREGDAATEYDALDEMVAGETRDRLRGALERLSPTQREVFRLRIGEGLSYKEIARVVGTTEGAARVHYHNALRQVKENLYV
ncbi:MAG: RNA polymerase sigma factor [Gemmatimonadota bacterium]